MKRGLAWVCLFLGGCLSDSRVDFDTDAREAPDGAADPVGLPEPIQPSTPEGEEQGRPILRVNMGGGQIPDAVLDWQAHSGHIGSRGGEVDRGEIAVDIAGLSIPGEVFQTESYCRDGFRFALESGTYAVRLYFAETSPQVSEAGQRLFDIRVEDEEFSGIDPVAEVGPLVATKREVTVQVVDGWLDIMMLRSDDCPIINALEVWTDAPTPNDDPVDEDDPQEAPPSACSAESYEHPLWGPVAQLTPPRPLLEPFMITDLERGRPSEGFSETGPNGQQIRGRWIDAPDSPQGRIWQVTVNGNGRDVWIDGNRDTDGRNQVIDYNVTVQDARTLRVSGLEAFITDIRSVAGGWPDCQNTPGPCGLFTIRDMPEDTYVFIEGMNIDLNEGGAREMYRTDAFNSHSWGDADNDQETLVLQNSRVLNVSSDYEDTHADIWHFQGGSGNYLRWFIVENADLSTKYQGFQQNYFDSTIAGGPLPTYPLHNRYYNVRFDGQHSPVKLFYLGSEQTSMDRLPSVEYHNTYVAKPGNPWAPDAIVQRFDRPSVVWNSDFLDARRNITRRDGTVQPRMVNVDSNDTVPGLHFYDSPAPFPPQFAPASATGANFEHIWDESGRLICLP
ncbi:MAG: malectin domain-containing carbohydrate-binding protein [Myxococcota bacterium]